MEQKISQLKQGMVAVMQQMQQESNKSTNISKPQESFKDAFQQMLQPEFNVVVCGEVKRGKSTFINALIGRELLPTGVKETTSQVFRVTHSDKEEFLLQFDDGSKQNITHEQLKHYGSQVDADLRGENIFGGKQLLYIQANIPIEFLPKGVTIVDTPGLGALYKSHEEITHNYISQADAVVFILDTDKPLVQQEQEFLANHVFTKTPYVLFIMTKVDAVDESAWVDLIRRNEVLLRDSFEDKCYVNPKIFPVASTLLFEAAEENDEEEKTGIVEDSLFPEAKDELMGLMNRTVGLFRNTMAYNESIGYLKEVIPVIEEQLKMVSSQSKDDQQQLREQKASIVREFEKQWGPQSTLRSKMITKVQRILNGTRNNASQLLSPSHQIYKSFLRKIENADSSDIQGLADKLGESVVGEISNEWKKITQSAERQVTEELNRMYGNIQQFKGNNALAKRNNSSIATVTLSEASTEEQFAGFRNQFMNASVATGVGGFVLVNVLGVALGPIGWTLLGAGSIIYSIFGGKRDAERRQLEKNKVEIKKYLNDLYDHAKQQLLFVSVMEGRYSSTIDAFVYELQNAAEQSIQKLYEQSKDQFDAECRQLDKQAKLNNEQRKEELQKLNEQNKVWLGLGSQLTVNYNLLLEIDKRLN